MSEKNENKKSCNYVVDVACVISVRLGGEPTDEVVTIEPGEVAPDDKQLLMDAIVESEEVKEAFKNLSAAVAYHRKSNDGKYMDTKAYMTIANGVVEMIEV